MLVLASNPGCECENRSAGFFHCDECLVFIYLFIFGLIQIIFNFLILFFIFILLLYFVSH